MLNQWIDNVKKYPRISAGIVLTFIFSALLRILATVRQTGFAGDQAYHGEFIVGILDGVFPTLGSITSASGFSLLPLHYYLFAPFSIFSRHPFWQAFPNTVFSILSVGLLMYLTYKLFDKATQRRRLIYSLAAGIWWGFLYNDVLFSSFEWNPNSIPFFVMCFLLAGTWILDRKSSDRLKVAGFVLLGVLTAILGSLHSTTLFVFPIVFSLFIIWYIWRYRVVKLPLIGVGSFFLVLLPYWYGEIKRGGQNTNLIFESITNSSEVSRTIGEKISRAFFNYLEIGHLMYFDVSLSSLAMVFLVAILGISLLKFRGNNPLWNLYWLILVVYFVVSSNYWGPLFVHYKSVFWFAPIWLSLVSLEYFWTIKRGRKYVEKIAFVGLIIMILLSVHINFGYITNLLRATYGADRMVGVDDYVRGFEKLEEGSRVCFDQSDDWNLRTYRFIDDNVTNRNLVFVNECEVGDYVIAPKNTYVGLPQNQLINEFVVEEKYDLVTEFDILWVLQLNSIDK